MATFCTNCGTTLQPGQRFCSGCGEMTTPEAAGATAPGAPPPHTPLPTPSAGAPPPPHMLYTAGPPPPMPPPSGGSGMKVLFIVLGVVFVIALIGVAAVAYLGFYVKNRVERAAKDYGIEASSRSGPSARRVDPCSLISKEEAGVILGVAIERTETDGEKTCQYFAKALTQEEREQAMAKLQSQDSAPRDQKDVENMAKAMVSAMAGGAGPSFGIEVEWDDGRTMLNAFKFVTGTAGGGDTKVSERVSGIGDEAVLGPMASMLMFVKGSTGVQIDLRMVPDAREKGVAIAKIVAGRLVLR